jgi:hypothetical protein
VAILKTKKNSADDNLKVDTLFCFLKPVTGHL